VERPHRRHASVSGTLVTAPPKHAYIPHTTGLIDATLGVRIGIGVDIGIDRESTSIARPVG
jgi:hypothetical protein